MPSLAKELILKELLKTLESKNYIFFAHYQGLAASEFVELRRKLEKVVDRTVVVKNTLTRLAFKQLGFQDINGLLKGSVLLAIGKKDPQLISRVLVDFAKGRDNFKLEGALVEGQVVPALFIQSLANLPSREVLLATVVNRMNAPISGFVNVLAQLMRSLVTALDQIQQKKSNQSS